jgi:hypothetical protein
LLCHNKFHPKLADDRRIASINSIWADRSTFAVKYREPNNNKNNLHLIDDVLEQCARELELLAEVYRKRGLSDHAQELSLASENIRRGPNQEQTDEDEKAS